MSKKQNEACRDFLLNENQMIKNATILFFLMGFFLNGIAQKEQHILKQGYTVEFFKKNIQNPQEWVPYPTANESEKWKQLLTTQKYDALVNKAESLVGYNWPVTRASVFLDYVRNGNRTNFEDISFSRRNALASLVLGELIENKGRFTDDIVDGIWSICEETFWGVPAHLSYQKRGNGLADVTDPVVDLFAAETASMLAWVSYLLGDKLDEVSPLIKERISLEIDRRIIKVIESDPQYRWMGYGSDVADTSLSYAAKSFLQRRPNNWNPWISSNILTCILLLENNKQRRADFVFQVFDILDNYLEPYPADGGCDEGTGYWGRAAASTFDCLDLVKMATDNQFNIFDQPLIKNMGEFISRAYIGNGYYLNFADAVSKTHHSPMLVYRFGKAVDSQPMMEMGAFLATNNDFDNDISHGFSLLRILPELFYSKELLHARAKEPLIQNSWWPDIQLMVSRDRESTTQGIFLAAKGGHNEESHNHNDVGSFIVFKNGAPAIIDIGGATYTKNYSNSSVKKSEFHNLLPVIDGEGQQKGRKYSASNVSYSTNLNEVVFSQDISQTYSENAGIKKWERTFTHRKGQSIVIADNYEFDKLPDSVWLPMIINSAPDISTNGLVVMNNGKDEKVTIGYDPKQFEVESEIIAIDDEKISSIWGDTLYRLHFNMKKMTQKGQYRFVIQ